MYLKCKTFLINYSTYPIKDDVIGSYTTGKYIKIMPVSVKIFRLLNIIIPSILN